MIVLDTHVWIWWLSGQENLSEAASGALALAMEEEGAVILSTISVWEVAMLVQKGRLSLSMPVRDWIRRSEALPFLRFVPLDNAIILRSVELGETFHADPADRFITATAISMGLPLITKDSKIQAYKHVQAVW